MSSKYMKADVLGVGKLISERGYFRVPDHQRDYAWPTGAVEQFLEDIDTALKSAEPDYFIGLIVLVGPESNNSWQILDGQQRLATVTMIYSSIRSWLMANGFEKDAQKVQERYIGISELGETRDRPRILLNVKDREMFETTVANQVSDDYLEEQRKKTGRNSSQRKLIEAITTCRKYVSQFAKEGGVGSNEQAKQLFKLSDYLRDKVHVAYMDVASSGNAYVIFESLNDRGIDLSVLDLVKNYIFGTAGTELTKVQNNWIRMTALLGDRKADDFLKVFWTSRYGRVQKGTLFNKIKAMYATKIDAIKLSQELNETVELYAGLDLSDSDIWEEHSETTRGYIKTLALLGATQVRPILLSTLFKLTPARTQRLLCWLVILIVRYQTVGGGRTGRLEQQIATVAPKIFSGDLKTPSTIWDQLKTIVPKDDEFMNDFRTYAEANATKARYILSQLESTKWLECHKGEALEKIPCPDPSILNLDHILPEHPSNEWNAIISSDKKIISECLNNIGNLCLTRAKANKEVGSSSFSAKCERIYKKSDLLTTSHLAANYTTWNRTSIELRAKELSEVAVKAWPIKE